LLYGGFYGSLTYLAEAVNSCILATIVRGAGKFFLFAGSDQDIDSSSINHKCSKSAEKEATYLSESEMQIIELHLTICSYIGCSSRGSIFI